MKRAKLHCRRAAQGAQPGRALAAARQGRPARQDQRGEAPPGQHRTREARNVTRIPTSDPTTLCRSDLESGRMRELYIEAAGDPQWALTDEQLSDSLTATLRGQAERRRLVGVRVRVAAVESAVSVRRGAAGDRCAACTGASACTRWRRAARPTQPGLVLGLDRGGACTGVVYRLPAPVAMDELHLLWRREMVVGVVSPALGPRAIGRARDRRADVRRPARASAIRRQAAARRARRA